MPSEKRERQRANREAKLAAQAAATRRSRLIRWSVIALVIVAAGVVGVLLLTIGSSGEEETATGDPAVESDTYTRFREQPTACGADRPPPAADLQFDAPGTVESIPQQLGFETSCGPVTIDLDPEGYPETVNSIVFLAQQGFFDGIVCHRLVEDFVLQCGDPTGVGTGDAGYEIADEFPPEGFVYERGVVAMANAGPGTTGSQFFVVLGDGASALPPQYSLVGTVDESTYDTLDALAEVPVGPAPSGEQSLPTETVYIETTTESPVN